MELMEQHLMKIPSKAENVALIEKIVNNVCESHQVQEENYGNILIALTEAVNNAIIHGNKENPLKNVDISIDSNNSNIRFIIKDEGNGFDYNNLPDPTAPENIEKLSGRGVFLMRNLADKVEFSNNGSTVTLDFKLSAN